MSLIGVLVSKDKSMTLPFITSTEYRYVHLVFQEPDQIFHVGSLSGAAYCNITYRDDRRAIGVTLQETRLEEHVPEAHPQSVKPTEW